METKTFECARCHKRARSSIKFAMPCPAGCGMMQDVTGKTIHMFECGSCGKRTRSAIAFTISCQKCHCTMTKVS